MSSLQQRYARQIQLPGMHLSGQEKLSNAKVLVVGCGGLGCPVLSYLAAAGVGKIGLMDFDTVELSNLQRQPLYDRFDIGRPKAKAAAEKLMLLNESIAVYPYQFRLTQLNALEIFTDYDIIVDCTDNFSTRYIINDACVLLQRPFIYGSVFQYEGQVSVFNFNQGPTYRCLFPVPPDYGTIPDCETSGIIGTATGVTGMLQATEAIKIICGLGEILSGIILTYNSLHQSFYTIAIEKNASSIQSVPKDTVTFKAFNYTGFCGEPVLENITAETLLSMNMEDISIVDVREPGEEPKPYFTTLNIPLSTIETLSANIALQKTCVVMCNSGSRSSRAIPLLQKKFPDIAFLNLSGGMSAIQQYILKETK